MIGFRSALPAAPVWPLWKRLGLRFVLLYSLFYATNGLFVSWHALNAWVAQAIFQTPLPPTLAQNGSGDTLEQYLSVLLYLAAALLLTLFWSVADWRSALTERLFWPWHTLLRFYVAFFLLVYGWSKILLAQMPAPDFTDLLTPLGAMSPMGLLWRSVGASPLFEVAGGLAEALAGALLLSRRTSLPGALLGAGLMGYVLLLNLSYDVPVKLFSAHLLLSPFWPRVWAVLLNRPAVPVVFPAPPQQPWLKWGGRMGGGLMALAILLLPPYQTWSAQREYDARPADSRSAGIYRVVNDTRPADTRWQQVALSNQSYSSAGH